ncbi:MAG: alanine--glyoxylate aminotransferase family protein [Planctomycetes bacterium]|nr:alanine--glyoxylate aminotransferase family protein [Planctomycetota bacterium]
MHAFFPPERLLLGPGPSAVPASVLRALGAPTIGHLDPEYLSLMDETRAMLRALFRTENEMTLAIPGTGSAGMETSLVNMIEPGDRVVIGVSGVFGGRLCDIAERAGARVERVEVPWGEVIEPGAIHAALSEPTRLVAIVHAETSTGAHQPLQEISRITHEAGALLVVDAVTSLGGVELRVDDWDIDVCYSGTQKCLSCPPGLAPVTFSPRAIDRLDARTSKVQSWYLDVSMLRQYWGEARVYHHTAPINMTYALHEAVRLVLEEGLDACVERHSRHHRALRAGLEAIGLEYIPTHSLTTLNAVHVPTGVDEAAVRRGLLERSGIEIGAGLGPFKGKAWRIGLMGHSAREANVLLFLAALEGELARQHRGHDPGASVAAANASYASIAS